MQDPLESEKEIKHREQAAAKLSPEGRRYFSLIEFDANEELITEIRKHPFGLFLVLLTGGFVILVIFVIAVFLSYSNVGGVVGASGLNNMSTFLVAMGLLLSLGAVVVTGIAAFLYLGNVIFVTNEKIAQVLYISLFHRKISQLSIGDVQDVTVTQKGIFAHFFNYGTLVIETAGEQQNYTFTFVPDPHRKSKLIVGAHERNMILHGN